MSGNMVHSEQTKCKRKRNLCQPEEQQWCCCVTEHNGCCVVHCVVLSSNVFVAHKEKFVHVWKTSKGTPWCAQMVGGLLSSWIASKIHLNWKKLTTKWGWSIFPQTPSFPMIGKCPKHHLSLCTTIVNQFLCWSHTHWGSVSHWIQAVMGMALQIETTLPPFSLVQAWHRLWVWLSWTVHTFHQEDMNMGAVRAWPHCELPLWDVQRMLHKNAVPRDN